MTRSLGAPGEPLPPSIEPAARLLRDLIHDKTGSYFADDRLGLMMDKLQDRLEATQSAAVLDYYYLLKYDDGGAKEWRRLLDAFTVHETYFWREADQIRALVEHVVPEWFRRTSAPLRIWSAACASGEEPYSLAIALLEAGWGSHPVEILATDASDEALQRAAAGTYRERSFRAMPAHLRQKYFEPTRDGERISPDIQRRVSFSWANLVSLAERSDLRDIPVIYCRNVFIYFSTQAISRVVSAFAERQETGHCLFVGASESLLKLTDHYDLEERAGAFVYLRNSIA